jgi:ribosome-associated heat shock protein Hsp15
MSDGRPTAEQRIDQWLWYSRLVKSRTLGQALIARGKVRINRQRIDKASLVVRSGDVLTLSLGPRVRVFEITGIGARRGSAAEAAALYREIDAAPRSSTGDPPGTAAGQPLAVAPPGARLGGAGRPTKRDRRMIDRLRNGRNGREEL